MQPVRPPLRTFQERVRSDRRVEHGQLFNTMNPITEQSWALLNEIRAELKLDNFYRAEHRLDHVTDWDGPPVKPPMEPLVIEEDKPRPGEKLRIDWMRAEVERTGYALSTVKQRMNTGYYDKRLEFRHVSERRVYVKEKTSTKGQK